MPSVNEDQHGFDMTVDVATIAERALRRLGVAIIPVADRPMLDTMVPPATIATNALIELGLLATGQTPPSSSDIVPLATIATDALIALGVIATDVVPPSQAGFATFAQIATNALTKLGVIAADETPSTSDQALAVLAVSAVHNSLVAQAIADWTPDEVTFEVSEEYAALTAMHLASSFGKASDPALVPVLEGRVRTVREVRRAQGLAMHKAQEVHDSLEGAALASWTEDTVPAAVAEEYTRLTAINLASSFGKDADPQMVPVLEQRIGAVSRLMVAQAQALAKVQQVQASLTSQALVWWDDDGVPMAVAEEYTRLTAMALAPGFSKQADPQMVPVLEARVRRMAIILSSPDEATAAVMAVHNNLIARGLARWTVFDLPTAAEMPYEVLAANRLAPLYDKQFDPNAELLAMRGLAQIIALESSGERTVAEYF